MKQRLDPALLATLRGMRRRWGRDSLTRLDGMFAKQRSRLEEMGRAAAEGDAETVVEISHFLKGTARALGAERLTELFERQEARARGGDAGGSETMLAEMREEWENLGEAFRVVQEED